MTVCCCLLCPLPILLCSLVQLLASASCSTLVFWESKVHLNRMIIFHYRMLFFSLSVLHTCIGVSVCACMCASVCLFALALSHTHNPSRARFQNHGGWRGQSCTSSNIPGKEQAADCSHGSRLIQKNGKKFTFSFMSHVSSLLSCTGLHSCKKYLALVLSWDFAPIRRHCQI